MIFFYQISIYTYSLIVRLASFFNPKAKLWINGRANVFKEIKATHFDKNLYWFHCASLGEYEQGKPLIEKLKATDNTLKILVTFFSPSGYELKKNDTIIDYCYYLPIDSKKNAQQFIKLIKPKKAFFIKYEFWYFYLAELNNNNIPTYLISGVFRKNQLFFKWYGSLHKKMLQFFTYFFVQDENSNTLLNNIGYNNSAITGDTRIDRVYENSLDPQKPQLIKKFTSNKKTIVLGSSWEYEEKIITEFIASTKKDFKYIIAPHNINKKHIGEIEKLLGNDFIKYSEATYETISSYKTLIIDNIGILANIYQFTDIAFIGGGFTGALHNILEPASFGNVVLFGPKHKKFHEAKELIQAKSAHIIKDSDDLIAVTNHLLQENNLADYQKNSISYIKSGRGATMKIINQLSYTQTK